MNYEQSSQYFARTQALPLALAALCLLGLLLAAGRRPPAPRPADAPANEFSAERALQTLERLLAENRPHPVGSAENHVVRERIIGELTQLGYDTRVQRAFVCRARGGSCAFVENIITRLAGTTDSSAVMLTAHYDSRGAAPGAGDDGAGVAAILEIARILRTEAPFRHPIILLFTDGEEPGLLGAEAFVREHPWARDVAVAINIEGRGSAGPSILFETSEDNRWLVDVFGDVAPRPVANSLSYEIYRILPNDTDASVYKRAGMAVFNFAFIGEVARYHSGRDDIAHLSARSVQHHGDNALPLVRRLARMTLQPRAGNAAYTDFFGVALMHWPLPWVLPLAVGFTLLLLTLALVLRAQQQLRAAQVAWGLLTAILGVAAALVVVAAATALLHAITPRDATAHAHAPAAYTAVWAASALGTFAVATLLARRAGFWGLTIGAWLLMAALTVAAASTLPGAAVVLLLPVIVAVLALLFATLVRGRMRPAPDVAVAIAALGAGFTLLQLAPLVQATFVLQMPLAIAAVIALAALPLTPLLAVATENTRVRSVVLVSTAVLFVGAFIAATALPGYSDGRPKPLNIIHWQYADTHTAHWIVQGVVRATDLPAPMRAAASFADGAPPPWFASNSRLASAAAPSIAVVPPKLEVLSSIAAGRGRNVTLRATSPRGGHRVLLSVPRAHLQSVTIEGQQVRGFASPMPGHELFIVHGLPPKGVMIEVIYADASPKDVMLLDHTQGLPPVAQALLRARPAWAAPYGDGDITVLIARLTM